MGQEEVARLKWVRLLEKHGSVGLVCNRWWYLASNSPQVASDVKGICRGGSSRIIS